MTGAPALPAPRVLFQPCVSLGFYPVNHTDCLVSALHHCFDGPTGELAHAFFPPHGSIHFDDSEHWVLGPTRYSWKKGDLTPWFGLLLGATFSPLQGLQGKGFGAARIS